jgi:hypothetical protein
MSIFGGEDSSKAKQNLCFSGPRLSIDPMTACLRHNFRLCFMRKLGVEQAEMDFLKTGYIQVAASLRRSIAVW